MWRPWAASVRGTVIVASRSTRSLDSTPGTVTPTAERKVVCVKPSGERLNVLLSVGPPYQSSPGEWACPVAATGLQARFPDIRGVDSFQSLTLAQSLLKSVLLDFEAAGCKFTMVGDETRINVQRMFDGAI